MLSKDNKNLKVILGINVRYHRYSNNLTQEKLAEKCELSPRYISDIENGNGNISIETLSKIAEVLNVKAFELVKEQSIKTLPQKNNIR